MSPLRLSGSISGYSEIEAPANAGSEIFTLPGTGGTLDRLNRVGNILQVVNYQTGAYNSTVTTIPFDDTIPQNTEGAEFMSLSITPTSASNKLLIVVTAFHSTSAGGNATGALFQDSTANALAAKTITQPGGTYAQEIDIIHYMTSGTTSSTTFKFRMGVNSGTLYFNGIGSRYLGGVANSGMTIMEIAA